MSSETRPPIAPIAAIALVLLAVLTVAIGISVGRQIAANPAVPLLVDENGAEWIRLRAPITLRLRKLGEFETRFATSFRVDSNSDSAILYFRAMKRADIWLDGRPIYTEDDPDAWKNLRVLDLGSELTPGEHRLRVTVRNVNGPRLLLMYSEDLGIATGNGTWEVSEDNTQWAAAQRADEIVPSEVSRKYPRPLDALPTKLPVLLPAFLMIFLWTVREQSKRPQWLNEFTPDAGQVRWLLLGAWALLAVNNAVRIPPEPGFDSQGHMNYIDFIVTNKRLPLATDGWQMFQTPLFYIVSAIPFAFLKSHVDMDTLTKLMRVIPLLCGAAQIEICYRVVRRAFPSRNDLQIAGTALGGFLPINIYMSQFVANEPLVALFTGLAVLTVMQLLTDPAHPQSPRTFALLGLLLGLAILSKFTAVLLIPPLLGIALYTAATRSDSPPEILRRAATSSAAMLSVAALVSGWYFVRNWIHLGKPFVGGWDPARKIVWWQEPGYRTPEQFYQFGESLVHPVYASAMGLLDSLYATLWLDANLSALVEYFGPNFWDYNFLALGAWFGLIPTIAIAVGVLKAIGAPIEGARNGALFALACLGIYFAAIAYLYLRLPVYSTAKASYTLGLAACYALLGAAGLRVLGGWRPVRAVLYGLMAVWAVNAYLTYFAI